MTELEIFNKRIEEFVWRALVNPNKIKEIKGESNVYINKIIKEISKRNIDNASKVKTFYDFRAIFKKVINLDLILNSNKFLIPRIFFQRRLKKIQSPFDTATFSKIVKKENATWEEIYNKFTPKPEVLKALKLEKIEDLNIKRANLIKLNLNLEDFQKFLVELYNQKDKSIYISLIIVMLCCGRRPAEIFNKETIFKRNGEKLEIVGLAKKRESTKKDSVVINTFLSPNIIINLRNFLLLKLPRFLENSTKTCKANKFFKEHLASVFHGSLKRIYDSRALFAIYSYERWGAKMEKNYYISQILGHEETDLETAFCYNTFLIPKISTYSLVNFNIPENKKIDLRGKRVSREKLEKIKNNPRLKKSFLMVAEVILNLFPDRKEITYERGLNFRIRENSKKIVWVNFDPKAIKEALEFIFLH